MKKKEHDLWMKHCQNESVSYTKFETYHFRFLNFVMILRI